MQVPEPASRRNSHRSGADRRAEIAEAAVRCMKRDGYANLTARKVAAEAGLALGHISYHFENMAELLSEAYKLASAQLMQATIADLYRAGDDPEQRLRAFLSAGFSKDFLANGQLRLRIDLWSAAQTQDALHATEQALYHRYREMLDDHLRKLSPDQDRKVGAASDAIMALLDGMWLDCGRRCDDDAIRNGIEACMLLAKTFRG